MKIKRQPKTSQQSNSLDTIPSATLMAFGRQHGLRLKRNWDDQWCIEGIAGEIYDSHENGHTLLVCLDTDTPKGKWWWTSVVSKDPRVKAATVGAALDGMFAMDIADAELIAIAIRVICVPHRRKQRK